MRFGKLRLVEKLKAPTVLLLRVAKSKRGGASSAAPGGPGGPGPTTAGVWTGPPFLLAAAAASLSCWSWWSWASCLAFSLSLLLILRFWVYKKVKFEGFKKAQIRMHFPHELYFFGNPCAQ